MCFIRPCIDLHDRMSSAIGTIWLRTPQLWQYSDAREGRQLTSASSVSEGLLFHHRCTESGTDLVSEVKEVYKSGSQLVMMVVDK